MNTEERIATREAKAQAAATTAGESRTAGEALKDEAIGGYAPGSYMNRCCSCGGWFQGDKRCVTCRGCAVSHARSADAGAFNPTHRHLKRGTNYEVIGVGRAQGSISDDDPVVLYRGADGSLWARHQAEFNDGRFASLRPQEPSDGK